MTTTGRGWARHMLRGGLAALLVFAIGFGASVVGAAFARNFDLTVDRVAVAPDLLPEGVAFLVGYELRSVDPRFRGLSGLEISDTELTAATDRGDFVEIDVTRGDDGAIISFGEALIAAQLDPEGMPYADGAADAEAIARDPVSGLLWTAYEHDHRIVGRRDFEGVAVAEIDQLPTIVLAPEGGVQALAAARDRSVIAIVSLPVRDQIGLSGAIGGWRLAVDRAERFSIRRIEGFRPSGADFGPDGALYLLETRVNAAGDRALRVRRFPAEIVRGIQAEADLGSGETVLTLTDAAPIGDMQGLAVDAGADGRVVLTMISDNAGVEDAPALLLQFSVAPAEAG